MSRVKKTDNIILTGIMGVGKSVVGESLAIAYGFKYVDTDELIEEEAGLTVKEVFDKRGEDGFRVIEKKVIADVAAGLFGSGLIVSTGGGAVIDPDNRKKLSSFGTVICLKADPEEIVRRLSGDATRPLLEDAGDLKERLTTLLNVRAAYYAEADCVINTTGKNAPEVVTLIKNYLD